MVLAIALLLAKRINQQTRDDEVVRACTCTRMPLDDDSPGRGHAPSPNSFLFGPLPMPCFIRGARHDDDVDDDGAATTQI